MSGLNPQTQSLEAACLEHAPPMLYITRTPSSRTGTGDFDFHAGIYPGGGLFFALRHRLRPDPPSIANDTPNIQNALYRWNHARGEYRRQS